MKRETAISRLKKALGSRATWQINADAPDADERATALARLREAVAELAQVKAAREARAAVLLADPEYRALRAQEAAIIAERDSLRGKANSYRITVGKIVGPSAMPGFYVAAQGDTWEEIFDKLKRQA